MKPKRPSRMDNPETLSHRKQDEDKEINKNAEHKTQNNAENQKDGQH